MLEIRTIAVGFLEENCYLAYLPELGNLYVIDPGDEAERILREARNFPFRRAMILLTHAHFDHIHAVGRVAAGLAAPVFLRKEDLPLYHSPGNCVPGLMEAAQDLPEPSAVPDAGEVEIVPLPGHSPGGAGFYFPAGPLMFVGDTLFRDGEGRTDLPGGSWEQLLHSIQTQIFSRPDTLLLYPGHGPTTTVGRAKQDNPYLQGE